MKQAALHSISLSVLKFARESTGVSSLLLCRHYVNQTAHPDFDPLKRRDSVLSAAFYDQMVVLVSVAC
jgi:hypothetical protein